MQIFYTDISKIFECDIQVIGAPLTDATARIIIDINDREVVFNGSINSIGHCVFNIPPLASYNILGQGILTLEVVVDNVLFKPFTDNITVKDSNNSDFISFTQNTDYDSSDLIDNSTWKTKRPYDEAPYIVLPSLKFNMAIGDTKPDLKFFVFKKGEQFGDPIPLPNMSSYTIVVKVYDYNSNLITFGTTSTVDQLSGQVSYTFGPLDFIKSGLYFFEVEFTSSQQTFTLPGTNIRNEIIIRD